MLKNELKIKLINKGIPTHSYSLNGGLPNEALCLNKQKNVWEVYYSEKGHKSEFREFKQESEACMHFYNIISRWDL
jgi:hypothetical protein